MDLENLMLRVRLVPLVIAENLSVGVADDLNELILLRWLLSSCARMLLKGLRNETKEKQRHRKNREKLREHPNHYNDGC